jgi:cell division septation protein DedD
MVLMAIIGQAYADFLPDEPQAPAAPSAQQTDSNAVPIPSIVSTAVSQAFVISIPSTPTSAPGQVKILRKGGLPAFIQNQGNQVVVQVGPELDKSNLLQQQKIVLELLNTPGTITSYQMS